MHSNLFSNPLASSSHFMIHRDFFWVLPPLEAILICDLIDLNAYIEKREVIDGEEHFFCSVSILQTSLNWSEDAQVRYLKRLQVRQLITVAKFGIPACRYVSLNKEKIIDLLKTAKVKK